MIAYDGKSEYAGLLLDLYIQFLIIENFEIFVLKIIRILLEKGADRNTENSSGYTPCHLAQYINNDELSQILLE